MRTTTCPFVLRYPLLRVRRAPNLLMFAMLDVIYQL